MYDSKHRTTDTQIYESRKDGSGYTSSKRDWNVQAHDFDDEKSNNRKYMRTQSALSNRVPSSSSTSQQQRQNGYTKSLKDTKKPLRVSGDWSEFKSSTGKTYFYNSKTEVSQWEKPKGWPSDEPEKTKVSSYDRSKKESITNTSRSKTEESSRKSYPHNPSSKLNSEDTNNNHQNENHSYQECRQNNSRLPSPGDDSSRMSFSSTSSKESLSTAPTNNHTNGSNPPVLHTSLCEPVVPVANVPSQTSENSTKPIQNVETKTMTTNRSISLNSVNVDNTPTSEGDTLTPTITKAEREQEIQKFYRAELIQHLTDWPSTQLEKQCVKLFDDYYGYSAKMSTTFTELKALKSHFRVLEIKRNILTQRLLQCEQYVKARENNNL